MTPFPLPPQPESVLPPQLQRAWIQWCGLLWQGCSTSSFPENDLNWVDWLRHTGLSEWQRLWLTTPPAHTLTANMMATSSAPSSFSTPSPQTELASLYHIPPAPNVSPTQETILLIPPCSHRATIFDIEPDASVVKTLTGLGHHVVILEWNAPPAYQTPPNLMAPQWTHYRTAIIQALQALQPLHNAVHVIGLCLGGVMALDMLTQTNPTPLPHVRSLTLLATLLDYRTTGPLSCLHWPPLRDSLRQHLKWMPWIPASLIYTLCCMLMPSAPPSPTPLSRWSQQGLNVSTSLALELLDAFYAHNYLIEPHSDTGTTPLSRLQIPLYAVGGLNDRLVPIHGLFNGLHHIPTTTSIRLSLFEAGHLRCFLPGRAIKGHQNNWNGESLESWLMHTPSTRTSGWISDWHHWIQTLP